MNDLEKAADRVGLVGMRLLRKLEQAVRELDRGTQTVREKTKTDTGEIVTETVRLTGEKGAVDRGGLKQLTGVLKDLQDILLLDPQMDVREREARLRKLERDLDSGAEEGVTVVLEGETEDFAG